MLLFPLNGPAFFEILLKFFEEDKASIFFTQCREWVGAHCLGLHRGALHSQEVKA